MPRFTDLKALIFNWKLFYTSIVGGLVYLLFAPPAFAHHPLDGRLPSNMFEGLMSGFAHPVIGLDHFAFVIAAGLVGVLMRWGSFIPMAFVLASLAGTGLHLMSLDLPAPEFIISASILLFGIFIARGKTANLTMLTMLGAIAGIFHGYAYGEAIIGAEMTPLLAYLLGFTSIQLAISLTVWKVGSRYLKLNVGQRLLNLRFIGFILCGIGGTFLSSIIFG